MKRRQSLTMLTAALAASCGNRGSLYVGAKNFVEQDILGEILTQHLERKLALKAGRKLHLGGSYIAHEALINGQIDLYPEYSGTALTACLKLPLAKDPAAVYESVRSAYESRHQVEWGWRLGFANTFAMVMRRDEAGRLGIATLSQAVDRKKDWKLGFGYEFEQRQDGWPSFRQQYPLGTAAIKTMDLGLIYRALAAKEVDLVAGNSTDPALVDPAFVELSDDRRFFPPYETCLAVRKDALARQSGLGAALDLLAGRIGVERMRNWNAQAVVQHRSVESIAAAFVSEVNHG